MANCIALASASLMFLALIVPLKTDAAPIAFSNTGQSSNIAIHGFRLESEFVNSTDTNQNATLVYLCAEHREKIYIIFPDSVNKKADFDLEFEFDNDDPIVISDFFINGSDDSRAFSLSYNASSYADNAPVRSVYKGLKVANELTLRVRVQYVFHGEAFVFSLNGTATAMRKANNAGGCDTTHLRNKD